jgi:thiosulfate dehydrogenase [quinone] large subunit
VNSDGRRITSLQTTLLVVLRFAIGWHFFYQGYGKLIAPYWSSAGYLNASWGPFSMIADNPTLLAIADYTMIWSLMILGFMIMVGLFTRFALICGALLLGSIYMAVPPLDYTGFVISTEQGTELYVNKTLIELIAMVLLASFDSGRILGLDILIHQWRNK